MTTVTIPVLDRCTKLNLFRAMRTVEMTPTASRVLQFLIDDATAPMWSLRRLAIAVGRSPRSVDAAIAELKSLGFIDVIYRRRATSLKVLRVDAILNAVSRAVCIAQQAARAAISMFRRSVYASQKHGDCRVPPFAFRSNFASKFLVRLLPESHYLGYVT